MYYTVEEVNQMTGKIEVVKDSRTKEEQMNDHSYTIFVVSDNNVFDLHADFLTREGVEIYSRALQLLIAIHSVEFRAIQEILIGEIDEEGDYSERVLWERGTE